MDFTELNIQAHQPLLLLDADEVLLKFIEHFEDFLEHNGYELRLDSFRLSGNVYDKNSGATVSPKNVNDLVSRYFEACVHNTPAVDGAADALTRLSDHFRIIILSNVPTECRDRREANLAAQGMPYPVIANKGEKGPFASALTKSLKAKSVFVDDLPPQLKSVRQHAPEIHLVHFVADPRLAALIDKAPHADTRHNDWASLEKHLMTLL